MNTIWLFCSLWSPHPTLQYLLTQGPIVFNFSKASFLFYNADFFLVLPVPALCTCRCAAPGKVLRPMCRAELSQPRAGRRTCLGWTAGPCGRPKTLRRIRPPTFVVSVLTSTSTFNTPMTSVDLSHILLKRQRVSSTSARLWHTRNIIAKIP